MQHLGLIIVFVCRVKNIDLKIKIVRNRRKIIRSGMHNRLINTPKAVEGLGTIYVIAVVD